MQLNLDQSVGKDARRFDSRQTFATPTQARATVKLLGPFPSDSSRGLLLSRSRSRTRIDEKFQHDAGLLGCTHSFIRY